MIEIIDVFNKTDVVPEVGNCFVLTISIAVSLASNASFVVPVIVVIGFCLNPDIL